MPSFDIETDLDKFETFIEGELAGAVQTGIYSTGLRLLQLIQTTLIPKATPHIPVDRGIYRAAWAIEGDPGGGDRTNVTPVSVYNSAPHAPIIEWGARAENIKDKIGRKMIDALSEWVVRKGIGASAEKTSSKVDAPERPAKPRAQKNAFSKALKRLLKNLADFIKRMRVGSETIVNEKGEKKAAAVSDAKARSIAWAIAKSMAKKGIFDGHGLRIAEQAQTAAPDYMEKEVAREIERRFK